MIRVFIGYDRQVVSPFYVLQASIHKHASKSVAVTPLAVTELGGIYDRPRHELASTDFSFSRFLAPYLCDFEGWSIFMDNDMMFRDDIAKLWALRDDKYAIQVVKHDHQPKEEKKFLNAVQTSYEKKNWSSVILFNNAKCKALTPEFVNTASGLELHQFKWLEGDEQIGEIPKRWNHLVGYDKYDPDAGNVHWTSGGPYFNEYTDVDYAEEWFEIKKAMMQAAQIC